MLKKRRRFHLKIKVKVNWVFIVVGAVIIFIILYITDLRIEPIVLTMSEAQAKIVALKLMDNVIYDNSKNINYKDLVDVRTDNDGKISMVQSNIVELNKIASKTSLDIQDKMDDLRLQKIRVPIGSLLNSQLFANVGPYISLGIRPMGTVKVDFKTQFDKAGINQTRHRIYLLVSSKIQIVAPLSSRTENVSTEVPIAEDIIIGDVPSSYYETTKGDLTVPIK